MTIDREMGQAWVKDKLFPRLKADYRDHLQLTDHYGWRTGNRIHRPYVFYFEIDGEEVCELAFPGDLLDECAHAHNTDDRGKAEALLRQNLEAHIV